MRCLLLLLLLAASQVSAAQQGLVRWAYGPFATPGDAAYVVERGHIFQACGPFGSRGSCLFVFNGTQVFRTIDGMGSRGPGAYPPGGARAGAAALPLIPKPIRSPREAFAISLGFW